MVKKTDHLPKIPKGGNSIQKKGTQAAAIKRHEAKTARDKVKMWLRLAIKGVDREELKNMGVEEPTLYDKLVYDAIVSAKKSKVPKDKREILKVITDISGEAPARSETQVESGINIVVASEDDKKRIDAV